MTTPAPLEFVAVFVTPPAAPFAAEPNHSATRNFDAVFWSDECWDRSTIAVASAGVAGGTLGAAIL